MTNCTNNLVVEIQNNGQVTLINQNDIDMVVLGDPMPPSWPDSGFIVPANSEQITSLDSVDTCLRWQCQDITEPKTGGIEINSVILSPQKDTYEAGEVVEVIITATNTSNRVLEDFTIDLEHEYLHPRLCCPSEPITDLTNFTLEWRHEQLPPGVTQVNVDGVLVIDGVGYDIGQSTAYTSGQTGKFSATYDITNILPAGPYNGPAEVTATYWYNGVITPIPVALDNNINEFECPIILNYS